MATTATLATFSLLLAAAGAVLAFAVTADVAGVSLSTIGVIMLIAGGVGLLLSFALPARHRTDERTVARG